jgi:ABC-type antimicrobial peptide transport system permease subunit
VFTVFGVLASCALALACVGVYGVASQAARARDREVAVRVALGATRSAIIGRFVQRGAVWIAGGVVVGVVGALGAGRLLESLLWGVEPTDPTTLLSVAFILGGSGLLASYLPARRASRIDPAEVLREE